MPLEPILQTRALTRRYRVGRDSVTALDHVDLAVQPGEFVAIMGPSGCGKSTLLNLIGGLDQPSDGQVCLAGQDLRSLNEEQLAALRRATLGFIFQRHDLFPVLTAQENVEFPLLLAGVPPAERRSRAEALLALVGLGPQAAHLPDELSGGQQQRVGIARALANRPRILLADEPTGNLDSATAAELLDALTSLVRAQGLTLVMVTHDPADAARADRVIRLKDGRVLAAGGPQ
jgi:putative ABC transport system ATP-binding protein